ncbi:hypothetical protein N2152v2_010075 [Parachlorella kessleri]
MHVTQLTPATLVLQKPTLAVLNLALLGCVLLIVSLLFVTGASASELLPHLAVLLFFAVGLAASVNWLVVQLGTVPLSQQREELFGYSTASPQLDVKQTEAAPEQAASIGLGADSRLDALASERESDREAKKAQ